MTHFFKGAFVALALTGVTLTTGCMMHRDADNDRSDRNGQDRATAVVGVSVGFADIGFGYSDGYWDRGHHWHQWANDDERANYRNYQGNHYHDWNHDRDGDDGWHNS